MVCRSSQTQFFLHAFVHCRNLCKGLWIFYYYYGVFLLWQTLPEFSVFSCVLQLFCPVESPRLFLLHKASSHSLKHSASGCCMCGVVFLSFRVYTFVKLLGRKSDFWRKKHGIPHRKAHPDQHCSSWGALLGHAPEKQIWMTASTILQCKAVMVCPNPGQIQPGSAGIKGGVCTVGEEEHREGKQRKGQQQGRLMLNTLC